VLKITIYNQRVVPKRIDLKKAQWTEQPSWTNLRIKDRIYLLVDLKGTQMLMLRESKGHHQRWKARKELLIFRMIIK